MFLLALWSIEKTFLIIFMKMCTIKQESLLFFLHQSANAQDLLTRVLKQQAVLLLSNLLILLNNNKKKKM
jgi:hypothetical protein